ncbi:DUF2642 domain-containing protein [Aquibacillus halophilus]|uniref:DUF2642 domain-containing protein n=1 Tax=Aquibacillus halophilus TaxID=930132 RepID=A0A6A8D9R6_9BACI|nr:DUF2642 domain-containing protein [Aquibacillus halophilus]
MFADAKPDYVVIQDRDYTFYFRINEIIWINSES